MPIAADWAIDYPNKRVYRNVNNVVYDVNTMYSWLMDTFDELLQMDDPVPMSAQTPTEYTMINGWFIDNESAKFLKNGSIKTTGYVNNIHILELDAITANPVPSDIGKQVLDDTIAVGALIAYEIDPRGPNTGKWWIRVGSSTIIGDNSVMAISTGIGAGTAFGISVHGEDLFANVYTLGTIADIPQAQIYIFQDGSSIAEWSDKTNWDRGHIDVLIKVKEAGTEIAAGAITVFSRQMGDLFDHFEIDLSAGGRNAVPLSTSVDLDNTSGDSFLLVDAVTAAFLTAGQIVTGVTSRAEAEMVNYLSWGTTGRLAIRGVKGIFADNEVITGSVDGSATANGVIGDTYLSYVNETAPFTIGQLVTGAISLAERTIRGIQDDGLTGKLVMEATQDFYIRRCHFFQFQHNENIWDTGIAIWLAATAYTLGAFVRPTVPNGWIYECTTAGTSAATEPVWPIIAGATVIDGTVTWTTRAQAVTNLGSITLVSGYGDIRIAHVNLRLNYDLLTVPFTEGFKLTGGISGATAIILRDDVVGTTGTLHLGNVEGTFQNNELITDNGTGSAQVNLVGIPDRLVIKAFELGAERDYAVVIWCNNRKLADVYEWLKFVCREDSVTQMYTSDGTTITKLDGEEYITAFGIYALKKLSPLGTFAGGKLFAAQGVWLEEIPTVDDKNFQLIDDAGFTQDPPNKQPCEVTSLVPGDRVVVFRTIGGDIDKSIYTSVAVGNTIGDPHFVVQEAILTDTPSSGVLRVYNADGTEERYPYSSWLISTFNLDGVTLTKTYDATSTAYVPFIDAEAIITSLIVTVIFILDRPVMCRVRRKGIIPFETTGVFGSAGYSVAAIRTIDAIVT